MGSYDLSNMTEGLQNLTDGYIAYATEVIINRALPNLYDGLKPVNRRILYTLASRYKAGEQIKCADLAGTVMKLHPHGDASIYTAMTLLTDSNGVMNVPLLQGQGNFGSVYTNDPPAAPRYTEVKMHKNAEQYLKDIDGVSLVPNYDSKCTEPEVLPVTYPAVLCNPQEGVAVGFSCNLPSFNFNEVIDLTLEYLRDGKCSTVICPDFPTGGYYIKNNKELDKLMRIGKATLKMRGKVTKVGKELTVVEFPYGVKVQSLNAQIQKANIYGIKDSGDTSDYETGASLLIDCMKGKQDDVLLSLYKNTDLQCNFSASLFTVMNGEPCRLGVWGIIEEWVKWRRGIVQKKLAVEIERLEESIRESKAFIALYNDAEKKDEFIRLVLKESDDVAVKYLLSNFDNDVINNEYAHWLTGVRLSTFRTGGKYITRYNELKNELDSCRRYYADVDSYIRDELTTLKNTMGHEHPRKTEITTTDYEFIETEEEVVKDMTVCNYVFSNNYLKKTRYVPEGEGYQFTALASDVLIALDNRGRVLRVYCEDLPYVGASERGIYLPRYFDLNETDDYRITWIGVMDGSKKMLLYKDGTVGFLDQSEWIDNYRRVKVVERGISSAVADILGAVIDVPECFFICDTSGRVGYVVTDNIKQKDRTARTRVFNLQKGDSISSYAPMTLNESVMFMINLDRYATNKPQYLESEDSLIGDVSKFVEVF